MQGTIEKYLCAPQNMQAILKFPALLKYGCLEHLLSNLNIILHIWIDCLCIQAHSVLPT